MESAGRMLRAQASRKQVFQTILPLLSKGLIRPAEGIRPARKDHLQIKEQVPTLLVISLNVEHFLPSRVDFCPEKKAAQPLTTRETA